MDTPQPADVVVVFVVMSELATISSRYEIEPGLLGPSVVSRVTSIPGGVTMRFRVLYAV